MAEKREIKVVGAVIVNDNKVLCAQRGDNSKTLAGYWEFPGGKVEEGENESYALVREIQEECLCDISVGEHIVTSCYEYDFATINLSTYLCALVDKNSKPQLTEHSQLLWISPGDIKSLRWAPADIETVNIIYDKYTKAKGHGA